MRFGRCQQPRNRCFHASRPAALLLRFVAVYCLLDAVTIVYTGALKGAGDTRFVLLCTSLATWLVWMPGEVALLLWLDAGLIPAWLWMTVFIFVIAGGFWLRFRRGRWKTIEMIHPEPPVVVPAAEAVP